MKTVAIIGAGFSGLGVCYHLQRRGFDVTVFDEIGIGGGASGIASGLLHPYPGQYLKLSWLGYEGFGSSKALLQTVGSHVYQETGVLRIISSLSQHKYFYDHSQKFLDMDWWSQSECSRFLSCDSPGPGVFIRSGVTVHANMYLQGLWGVCKNMGAWYRQQYIADLDQLRDFDYVIIAAGSGVGDFYQVRNEVSLRFNKGHVLIGYDDQSILPSGVISNGYITPHVKKGFVCLGSSYEREYATTLPCVKTAYKHILGKMMLARCLLPSLDVQACHSGIRVVNPKIYHPIVQPLRDKNLFLMTAMGSRGLLYHSYLGDRLAEQIMQQGWE